MEDINEIEAPAKVVRKRSTKRAERKPVGMRNIDTTETREGFYRRWVNDKGDRIKKFEEGWYDKVLDEKGTPVTRLGGGSMNQVLMEIPEDLYIEDQVKKHEDSAFTASQLLGKRAGKGEYSPNKPS